MIWVFPFWLFYIHSQKNFKFSYNKTLQRSEWTALVASVVNLPISALQNSCCGCAGWQLHPSTTSFMPAPSKRSTQSPREALRSWDMAMMTLTTPPLDKHSATTSDPVKFRRNANQAVSQQRGDGWEVEVVRWALLSWKAAVDRNVFISLKCTSEFKLEQITWSWRDGCCCLCCCSLSLCLALPPSRWTTHRETYNSWIQSHSGLECWEGRTQGASYVLNNLRTASSNAESFASSCTLFWCPPSSPIGCH